MASIRLPAFLQKPFSRTALAAKVREVLDSDGIPGALGPTPICLGCLWRSVKKGRRPRAVHFRLSQNWARGTLCGTSPIGYFKLDTIPVHLTGHALLGLTLAIRKEPYVPQSAIRFPLRCSLSGAHLAALCSCAGAFRPSPRGLSSRSRLTRVSVSPCAAIRVRKRTSATIEDPSPIISLRNICCSNSSVRPNKSKLFNNSSPTCIRPVRRPFTNGSPRSNSANALASLNPTSTPSALAHLARLQGQHNLSQTECSSIFSGTAGQAQAFQTELHNLDVNGEKHIANMKRSADSCGARSSNRGCGVAARLPSAPMVRMRKPRPQFTSLIFSVAPTTRLRLRISPQSTISIRSSVSGIFRPGPDHRAHRDTDVFSASDWSAFRSAFAFPATTPLPSTQAIPRRQAAQTTAAPRA